MNDHELGEITIMAYFVPVSPQCQFQFFYFMLYCGFQMTVDVSLLSLN